jgi:hypothetical protein
METEIEIHILKDGTNMITAMVAGRPIAMTMLEWQLFMEDMRRAIETHLTPRAVDFAYTCACGKPAVVDGIHCDDCWLKSQSH